MTHAAREAFQEAVAMRSYPKIEKMIDGHTGFLFINQYGEPLVSGNLEAAMNRLQKNTKNVTVRFPR